jgi:hypothetical protein
MYFTVEQKWHKDNYATIETKACSLLSSKNDLKALLAWGLTNLRRKIEAINLNKFQQILLN